ncbi:MAG: PAS domain-containing protein, partial [Chloroflexota bacterium]
MKEQATTYDDNGSQDSTSTATRGRGRPRKQPPDDASNSKCQEELAAVKEELRAALDEKETMQGQMDALMAEAEQQLGELNKEKAQSESILKALPDSVFVVDENRRITHWSEQAEKLTGYSNEEAMGKLGSEIFGING